MIFPSKNFIANSAGEEDVWKIFKKILPNNYVSFHNYYIGTQEADVVLLVPDAGILIIEIKGFYPQNIIEAIDNTNILLKNGNIEPSPYKQCRRYREKLLELFQDKDEELRKHIVAVSVCYPYLTREDVKNKHLDRIIENDLLITSEDLQSWGNLSLKITTIFNISSRLDLPNGMSFNYNDDRLRRTATILSPGFSFDEENETNDAENVKQIDDYSILVACNTPTSDKDLVEELFQKWKKGTKTYFYSSCREDCELLLEKALKYLNDNSIIELKNEDGSVFNLSIESIAGLKKNVRIENGIGIQAHNDSLEYISEHCNFNFEQYEAEHATSDDVVVRAGAGTGKTFLLVSRIAYLCWKNKYSSKELRNKLVLITFTNDATNEMKSRLIAYFNNIFRLTYCLDYFYYAESVECMNISTIDSIGKKIIDKYAFYLGLGNEVTITSGILAKKRIIHKFVNEYAKTNELISSTYYIEQFVNKIVDYLENRSIDADLVGKEFENTDFNEPKLEGLIKEIPSIIKEIEKETEERNQISVGHIIIYLRRITKLIKEGKMTIENEDKIDYLFVDEFQDTDDTQIELIVDFKKIYGYRLFAVGDPKQSIYRFRGSSDDKAFQILSEKVGYQIKEYPLVKNYRTNAQMLEYMDKVFVSLSQKRLLNYGKKDRLVGVKNKNEPSEIYSFEACNDDELEMRFVEALQKFRSVAKENETLAVLVRTNKQIEQIRKFCLKNNIYDVDIDTGGMLYESEAAIDMYKLLLALQNSGNPAYLFNLFTTSYSNKSLKKVELSNSSNFVQYFHEHLPDTLTKWDEYLSILLKEPVLKVVRTIIDDAKPWQIYSLRHADDVETRKIYETRYKNDVDSIFEKIATENDGAYLNLLSLIEFLKIMITTHQEEEERNFDSNLRIQCRTIHRAKGKEYSYVLFPFTDSKIIISSLPVSMNDKNADDRLVSRFIYSKGNMAYSFKTREMKECINSSLYLDMENADNQDQSFEEARIMYVALTRAKKGLMYIKKTDKKLLNEKHIKWQNYLEINND